MNLLLNRKRFIELVHSESFLSRFKGKHILNPDNIENYSDLQSEITRYKDTLVLYEKYFETTRGRNRYVFRNGIKVLEDNIEQLEFIIETYTGETT